VRADPRAGRAPGTQEAAVIADHNTYHVGEIVAARRALGVWE
jgi:hypothetical protein